MQQHTRSRAVHGSLPLLIAGGLLGAVGWRYLRSRGPSGTARLPAGPIRRTIMLNRPTQEILARATMQLTKALPANAAPRFSVTPVPSTTRSLLEITVEPRGALPRPWLEHRLGEALRQFKALIEVGEIATTEGQTAGHRSTAGAASLRLFATSRRTGHEGRHVPGQRAGAGGDGSRPEDLESERHRH